MKKLLLAFLLLGLAGILTVVAKNPTFIAMFTHPQGTITTGPIQAIAATTSGFNPESITIKAGTKVIWTNNSNITTNVSSTPPPANSDYPPLNLGNFQSKAAVSLIFDKPGTYTYYNNLNPFQHGKIIVLQ